MTTSGLSRDRIDSLGQQDRLKLLLVTLAQHSSDQLSKEVQRLLTTFPLLTPLPGPGGNTRLTESRTGTEVWWNKIMQGGEQREATQEELTLCLQRTLTPAPPPPQPPQEWIA